MAGRKQVKSLFKPTTNKIIGEAGKPVARNQIKLKFSNPKQMRELIDQYYDVECSPKPLTRDDGSPIYNKDGTPATTQRTPSQSGLAIYLGFSSRHSLYDYENKPLYSSAIKYARSRLSEYLEAQAVHGKNPSGAIFLLQNLKDGWRDAKYIEHNEHAPKVAVVQFIGKPDAHYIGAKGKQETIDITAESVENKTKCVAKCVTDGENGAK